MPQTVLITGATAGFGEACARLFAEKGWRIIITGRRKNRLDSLAKELSNLTEVLALCFDVRHRDAVDENLSGIPEKFKDIDLLINNAGLALGLEPAHRVDLDDWETMIDTNIKGLVYCSRFILPGMVARNCGHIINIGSVAGSWPYPGGNVYGATKAFVKQFTNNLKADLLGTAVRTTSIEPGFAETEFSVVRFKGDTEKAGKFYEGTEPLTAIDIAGIVYWVATLPPHVNINSMEVMPTCQSWNFFAVHKKTE
ncbi:MAG: SDR family oxidoreductase [Proteobacteria bacterium]|nr:SDR family oxidoreductase [Pseudomonadota bacterium]MBU1710030.1 SDR family oxidoreductase [Pseudomonadota bacterium]